MGQVKTQDRLRPVLVAVLALACASCATRPLQGVLLPTESVSGASRIPILIATMRQRSSDDPGEMFTGECADPISYAKRSLCSTSLIWAETRIQEHAMRFIPSWE
jgi:esterase/lipase superfamily enzyme